jgi:hypothetical protein
MVVLGVILCRFESGSLELREVGRYLRTKQTQEFQPYFTIEDQQDTSFERKVRVSSFAKCYLVYIIIPVHMASFNLLLTIIDSHIPEDNH